MFSDFKPGVKLNFYPEFRGTKLMNNLELL